MSADNETVVRLGSIILECDVQTRISSFLIGIKHINASILAGGEIQPMPWEPYALLHDQLFHELELIGLLRRVTEWSVNPVVYFHVSMSYFRHLAELEFFRFMWAPFTMDERFYRYLALTHGLYAHLRFIPLLPPDMPLEHPYLAFLRKIETVHGQQMQAQIALLRKLPVPLSDKERERIVGEESRKVRDVFRCFVEEITV